MILDARWNAHAVRAEVELDAGHIQAALDDAREGLRLSERLRPNLLPADPFKLGFAERRRYYFDFAVSLMMQAGHVEEAFAASEQGRSRAFLDLLASQEVDTKPADCAELRSSRQLPRMPNGGHAPTPSSRASWRPRRRRSTPCGRRPRG